jgi:hypothetical protein
VQKFGRFDMKIHANLRILHIFPKKQFSGDSEAAVI